MRSINQLNSKKVESLKEPGRHADGNRLFLQIDERGGKSWIFMWKVGDKRRVMGLGSVNDVSLLKAREEANEAYKLVRQGRDHIEERRKLKAAMTFGEAVEKCFAEFESGWRNESHRVLWKKSLEMHAKALYPLLTNQITVEHVERVLRPLWPKKASQDDGVKGGKIETAIRLRGRIERILDWCRAHDQREGENPASWRILKYRLAPLPKKRQRIDHHAALPYDQISEFTVKLQQQDSLGCAALQFLILTAARSNEVLGARWNEIDLEKRLWTVPAERMKGGVSHVVPLSDWAMVILEGQAKLRITPDGDAFVFPGMKRNKPSSPEVMRHMLNRFAPGITVHGFRSTFRDWAGDCTDFPREICEAR